MDVNTTALYVSGLIHIALPYITLNSYSDPGRIVRIQVSGKTIAINTDQSQGWSVIYPALKGNNFGWKKQAENYYVTITVEGECQKTAPAEKSRAPVWTETLCL